MSSRRFPGKVLAPFRGQPILRHVIERVQEALPDVPATLVTSTHPTDDPLVAYAAKYLGVYRGALDDVLGRFRTAAQTFGAKYVMRVCADSPLLDPRVLQAVLAAHDPALDLVTTTAPRTFPKGSNAELINVATMLALPDAELTADDREHVTRFFHRHPKRFRIENVESGDPSLAQLDLAVDTLEDLQRLEAS